MNLIQNFKTLKVNEQLVLPPVFKNDKYSKIRQSFLK